MPISTNKSIVVAKCHGEKPRLFVSRYKNREK